MMILDCWLPTRFRKCWHRSTVIKGNTEIFSSGQILQNLGGRAVDTAGQFTKALTRTVRDYVDNVFAERDMPENRRRFKKAPRSIPEIMAVDKNIDSNPRRVWINTTGRPHRKLVKRIKIMTGEIRQSGMLEFYAMQIQPLVRRYQQYVPIIQIDEDPEPADEAEEEPIDDEGFDEVESGDDNISEGGDDLFVN